LKREIYERKRVEDDLRENEEKYRNILENMEAGYFEVDISGNLRFFNEALKRYPNAGYLKMSGKTLNRGATLTLQPIQDNLAGIARTHDFKGFFVFSIMETMS